MKKIKKITTIIMLIALLFTINISTTSADLVSTLNGKYIKVDGILFRVMNDSGYAVANNSEALGRAQWHIGYSKILGLAKNKSYIKEARYMTESEWSTYGGTLGNPEFNMWLQDGKGGDSNYFTFSYVYFPSGSVIQTYPQVLRSVRPALILESDISIESGSGSLAYPYILENNYMKNNDTVSESFPVITVVELQDFSVVIAGGDSITHDYYDDSNISGAIRVVNSNANDGYITITGILVGTGIETIDIEGKKIIFNKIAAPSGATVTATFN